MNLIIPHEYIAGFQKREKTFDGRLGFLTYVKEDGTRMSNGNFNRWIDQSIPLETYSNVPQSGFTLGKTLNHHSSFGGSSEQLFRIYTPNNIEIEITVENFLDIAKYCCVDKCYIQEDCVLAWKNSRIYLLSVNSPEYEAAKEFSEKLFKAEENITFNPGEIFTIKKHDKRSYIRKSVVYLGKMSTFTEKDFSALKQSNFKWNESLNAIEFTFKTKEPRHVFALLSSYDKKYSISCHNDSLLYDIDENMNGENYQKLDMSDSELQLRVYDENGKPANPENIPLTVENILANRDINAFFEHQAELHKENKVTLRQATTSCEFSKIEQYLYQNKLSILSADGNIYTFEKLYLSHTRIYTYIYNHVTKKWVKSPDEKSHYGDISRYKPMVIQMKNGYMPFIFKVNF